MAQLGYTFDSTGVEPSKGMGALAPGVYTSVIIDSDVKTTAAGTGRFIALTFKVEGGPEDGRQFWHNINIENPNEKAQQIGAAELSAILGAIGKVTIQDTTEMHGIPLNVTLGMERNPGVAADGTPYEPKNQCRKFAPAGHAPPSAGNGNAAHPPANGAATNGAKKPAWRT